MKTKLVIFDMDGVVIDSEKLYYEALRQQAESMGINNFTREYYNQFVGGGDERMIKILTKDYQSVDIAHQLIDGCWNRIDDLMAAGDLDLKPGYLELNTYLKDHNIQSILGTSSHFDKAKDMLENVGVFDTFDDFVTADDVETAKPAPDIFLQAWKTGGQPDKEDTLIIEDAKNGIIAANRAGIPVVMVPDVIQPDKDLASKTKAVCKNLKDVINVIQ